MTVSIEKKEAVIEGLRALVDQAHSGGDVYCHPKRGYKTIEQKIQSIKDLWDRILIWWHNYSSVSELKFFKETVEIEKLNVLQICVVCDLVGSTFDQIKNKKAQTVFDSISKILTERADVLLRSSPALKKPLIEEPLIWYTADL